MSDDPLSYLDDGPDPQPEVALPPESSLQELPTDQLSWQNHERLLHRLGKKQGSVVQSSLYGVPGEAQQGIDILFRLPDGTYRTLQSRRVRGITAGGVRKAVTEFLNGEWAERCSEFVLATSADASRTAVQDEIRVQTDQLAEQGITFDVWDRVATSLKLKDHPDLVRDFFGLDALRRFLPGAYDEDVLTEVQRISARDLTPMQPAAAIGFAGTGPDASDALLHQVLNPGDLSPDVERILRDLQEASVREAALLTAYIDRDPRRATDLIRHPQPWVADGRFELHVALGRLAAAAGQYEAAIQAFERADSVAPPESRARLALRTRDSALAAGDTGRAQRLFRRAQDLAPDDVFVRIAEIGALPPSEQLRKLEELQPIDHEGRNAVLRARVDALSDLEQAEQALAVLGLLEGETDSVLFVQDRRSGILQIVAARRGGARNEDERARLVQAVGDVLALRNEMLARGRTEEAASLLMRASELAVLGHDVQRGRQLLDQATEEELQHSSTRPLLAKARLHAMQPSAALSVLTPYEADWGVRERSLAARALALIDEPGNPQRATELARTLLDTDDVQQAAAYTLMIAAASDLDLPWPEAASTMVEADHPTAVAYAQAKRLQLEGNQADADQLLRRHASDDPDIARVLIERLIQDERWPQAIGMARRLAHASGAGDDRLLLARALAGAGQAAESERELRALAHDAEETVFVRSLAFAGLALQLAPRAYGELERLTADWLEADPDSVDAAWQRAFALARLARHPEALALAEGRDLTPARAEQAQLLAEIYMRTQSPVEATRRLAELSDLFDRQVEALEALLFRTASQIPGEIEPPLRTRITETVETFAVKFPTSRAIVTIRPDGDDRESLLKALREHVRPERSAEEGANQQVNDGQMPVAFLADTVGYPVCWVWGRRQHPPLSFGDPAEHNQETQVAAQALGSPVTWDSTSIVVVASLPETIAAQIERELPASVVSQACLDDCSDAAGTLTDRDSEQRYHLEDDGFHVTNLGRDYLDRERARLTEALEIARTLQVLPNLDPGHPDRYDDLIDEVHGSRPFDTVATTLLVSRRTGLPIFSDDRTVRRLARSEGIETFGTLALIDAMRQVGTLTDDEAIEVRRQLVRDGALGIRATGDELAQAAGEVGFQPQSWTSALHDLLGWRHDPGMRFRESLRFLIVVWREEPRVFPTWTARILNTAARALGRPHEMLAHALLVYTWFGSDLEDHEREAFVAALVSALEEASRRCGTPPFRHVVAHATRLTLYASGYENRSSWVLLVRHIMRQLRFPYSAQALLAVWRYSPPTDP
ncbi:hypothetical protein PAI11_25850 [Patulibacter medicamentivorans]|uniref:PIN domain-containing protein n=1 Tax=Patulibacter medicamentivorans TaxID=1097667 RepID=H0E6Y4_9ACTN|nr:hypothetical protein [Patulibacter medicamentivorans]EHN10566.1 hypothetical protein PAI11_25850 [Patulibacter medicamentivorans]